MKVNNPSLSVLISAGLQFPVILFKEVADKIGGKLYWHNGPIGAKSGVTLGVTVTDIASVHAQPSIGVNK